MQVLLTGPAGKAVVDGSREVRDGECVVNVPAGAKGVYRLQVDGVLWVSSSLDESVLWTGDPSKRHNFRERFAPAFQMVVPRHWWFWVPEGVTRFTCKVQRSSEYMSQREDWGIFVITPRGQRIRALWGQPPRDSPADYLQDMIAEVEVEPGRGRQVLVAGIRIRRFAQLFQAQPLPRRRSTLYCQKPRGMVRPGNRPQTAGEGLRRRAVHSIRPHRGRYASNAGRRSSIFRPARRWAIPTGLRCSATPSSPCGTRKAATCDFGSGRICRARAARIPRRRRSRSWDRRARPISRKCFRCSTSMRLMDNPQTRSRRAEALASCR